MTWFYILAIVILIYAILVSFYCFKFAILILKVQDSIESSLDKLDARYASINEIAQRPLFYDSPEVRKVLEDISASREIILEVANTLSEDFDYDQESLEQDQVDNKGEDEG